MSEQWGPIDCCIGGTAFFRERANIYLPQEPREDLDSWHRRVYHATFAPFTIRIAEQAAGLVLRKPIQLVSKDENGEVDPFWEEWATNVDGHGSSLDDFARRLTMSSVLYGHSGILVDYPSTEPAPNLAIEREMGLRPYFVQVDAKQILGWRFESASPIAPVSQIRINEYVMVNLGEFGDDVVRQIRVVEADRWRVYRRGRDEAQNWTVVEEGTLGLGRLPFVPIYSNRIAELISKPPLLSIAYLNIAHAQRTADLTHSLHVAALPMLVLKGFDDNDNTIGLSANTALLLPPEGDAMYVEPVGQGSFQAQQDRITQLENQMSSLGISTLFAQKMGAETAESKRLSRTDSDSLLAIISKDLERGLQDALDMAADYMGIDAPEVMIDRDFDLQVLDGQQVQQYMQLWMNGAITHETLLEMLKQGEVLPDLDIEMEVELVEQEKASNMVVAASAPGAVAAQAERDVEEREEEDDSEASPSDIRRLVEERLRGLAGGQNEVEAEE